MIRAALVWLCGAGAAQPCTLALVLALDVSASVDGVEYRLQLDGTAQAIEALGADLVAGPVALAATQWASADEQRVIVGWHLINSPAALGQFTATLRAAARPEWQGRTATGAALDHALALFAQAPTCARQVIDISTDDVQNDGPLPRRWPLIGVNALAVGGDLPLDHGTRADEGGGLTRWLEGHVISGPGAFVESADDWRGFARAMERKLWRELHGQSVAGAYPGLR
jgi:hypothetical protein